MIRSAEVLLIQMNTTFGEEFLEPEAAVVTGGAVWPIGVAACMVNPPYERARFSNDD